jgi:hypothetical protein
MLIRPSVSLGTDQPLPSETPAGRARLFPHDWSRDGKYIVFVRAPLGGAGPTFSTNQWLMTGSIAPLLGYSHFQFLTISSRHKNDTTTRDLVGCGVQKESVTFGRAATTQHAIEAGCQFVASFVWVDFVSVR